MNQRLLNHFDIVLNEKYFGFSFVPGTVNFDEVYAALDHFKSEVDKLKEQEEKRVSQLQESKDKEDSRENDQADASLESKDSDESKEKESE